MNIETVEEQPESQLFSKGIEQCIQDCAFKKCCKKYKKSKRCKSCPEKKK